MDPLATFTVDLLASRLIAARLTRVLADPPQFAGLAAGELVTSGTVTDAWPVARGETWSSDYGGLDLPGWRLRLT